MILIPIHFPPVPDKADSRGAPDFPARQEPRVTRINEARPAPVAFRDVVPPLACLRGVSPDPG